MYMLKNSIGIKNAYKNKNILVTGGTGSIGLELVKQLISCKPKSIKVLTNDELPFCHDIGHIYKITKKQAKHVVSPKDVNSATAARISKDKLHKVINELFDEVIY